MSNRDRLLVDLALRYRFDLFVRRCFLALNSCKAFEENWHHHAIYHALSQVRDGDLTRLIINIQPRSLKSLIVSIAYPAYVLGHDPRRRIYVISYGDDLADKHSGDFRAIVEFCLVQTRLSSHEDKKKPRGFSHHHGRRLSPLDDRHGRPYRPWGRPLHPR